MSAVEVRQEHVMDDETEWLSRSEYQERHRTSTSRMQVALREGRVPGAVKNGKGEWLIPADAPVLDRPPGGVVDVRPTPAAPTSGVRQATSDVRQGASVEQGQLPAFVDVRTAARLLGVPEAVVRENVAELDGRQWGRQTKKNGRAWVIPLATIRRFYGYSEPR